MMIGRRRRSLGSPQAGFSEGNPVVLLTGNSLEAVDLENEHLDRLFGDGPDDWIKTGQCLLQSKDGRTLDVIGVKPKDREALEFFFDISRCFR